MGYMFEDDPSDTRFSRNSNFSNKSNLTIKLRFFFKKNSE